VSFTFLKALPFHCKFEKKSSAVIQVFSCQIRGRSAKNRRRSTRFFCQFNNAL